MISVLMNVYNEEVSWIQEAIDSVFIDTSVCVELIVVVDNPHLEARKRDIILSLKEKYGFVVVFNKENLGPAECANVALAEANGDLIARLDSDDVCLPKRFAETLDYMHANNLDMVAGGAILINEEGKETGIMQKFDIDIEHVLPYQNDIIQSTVLMKADVIKALGGYRNLRNGEDYDLWLRMLSAGYKIGILSNPVVKYRVRSNSLTNSRRYEQYVLAQYVRALYKERCANDNKDSFSQHSRNAYLEAHKITKEKNIRCQKAIKCLDKMSASNKLTKVILFMKAFCMFPTVVLTSASNRMKRIFIWSRR